MAFYNRENINFINKDDYKIIIKLQLIVAEIVSYKNKNMDLQIYLRQKVKLHF